MTLNSYIDGRLQAYEKLGMASLAGATARMNRNAAMMRGLGSTAQYVGQAAAAAGGALGDAVKGTLRFVRHRDTGAMVRMLPQAPLTAGREIARAANNGLNRIMINRGPAFAEGVERINAFI